MRDHLSEGGYVSAILDQMMSNKSDLISGNINRPWDEQEEWPELGYAVSPKYDVGAFIDKLLDEAEKKK